MPYKLIILVGKIKSMLFLVSFLALYSLTSCQDRSCSSHCVLTPEEIEGPYYLPYHLVRKDIREGKPGLRLDLRLIIKDVNTCEPLPGVSVDIWHCDGLGYYSSYLEYDPNEPPIPAEHIEPTDNSTFMRGVQYTDKNGVVDFVTNFPGWYYGRTVHIHVKVFKTGQNSIHTGQLYFTEELTEKVSRLNPYVQHRFRRYRNEEDTYFVTQYGNETILMPKQKNGHCFESGLKAKITLTLNPNKTDFDYY